MQPRTLARTVVALALCVSTPSRAAGPAPGERLRFIGVRYGKEFTINHYLLKQPLVHGDPKRGSFDQRVDVLIPHGTPYNAPVLLNIGSELDLTDTHLSKGFFEHYGKNRKTIYVQIDHRGYGQSKSAEPDQSVPRYVSRTEAIEDAHTAIGALKADFTGPYVVAGWSYGGALALGFGGKHPEDVSAVMASSAFVRWPFYFEGLEDFVEKTFGTRTYRRLRTHIRNLQPAAVFDETWRQRESLMKAAIGMATFKRHNRLVKFFKPAILLLPTGLLVKTLHALDKVAAHGELEAWVDAVSKKGLNLDEAKTCKFEWRYFRHQQFTELGAHFLSNNPDGALYRSPEEIWCEGEALFGKESLANIEEAGLPLFLIQGDQDPTSRLELQRPTSTPTEHPMAPGKLLTYKTSFGTFYRVPDGFHGPDRDDKQIGRAIMADVLAGIGR